MSQTDENKALIRRLAMAFNEQELEVVDEIVAPDFVLHSNALVPDGLTGPAAFKELCVSLRTAIPDAYHPVENLIAEGDLVLIHLILQGTFTNPWGDIQPTGERVAFGLLNFWRVVNGKAVESWWNVDTLDVMQQFGVVPREGTRREELSTAEAANLALARRAVAECFNQGRLAAIPEVFASNVIIYLPNREVLYGHEGISSFITADRNAFPDLYWFTEEMMAARDMVIHRYIGYGTFTHEWQGIPATGNAVKRPGITTWRIADGRIVEARVFWDSLDFMQQLGAIPIPETPPPNIEANKNVVHRIHLSWNVEIRNMDLADELLAPNWTFHPSAQPSSVSLYGRDQFKAWAAQLVNALPDFRATIHDTVAEGDLVALRWTIAGTHTGEYMGAAATGNSVEVTGGSLWRVNADGQNTAIWFVMDTLNFMRQIGAIPAESA